MSAKTANKQTSFTVSHVFFRIIVLLLCSLIIFLLTAPVCVQINLQDGSTNNLLATGNLDVINDNFTITLEAQALVVDLAKEKKL